MRSVWWCWLIARITGAGIDRCLGQLGLQQQKTILKSGACAAQGWGTCGIADLHQGTGRRRQRRRRSSGLCRLVPRPRRRSIRTGLCRRYSDRFPLGPRRPGTTSARRRQDPLRRRLRAIRSFWQLPIGLLRRTVRHESGHSVSHELGMTEANAAVRRAGKGLRARQMSSSDLCSWLIDFSRPDKSLTGRATSISLFNMSGNCLGRWPPI